MHLRCRAQQLLIRKETAHLSDSSRHENDPPICNECELPLEEITYGYVFEWACANDSCAKRFHPTFEELIDPELLIIMGEPQCYRCLQPRAMTRIGNILRFDCANPACNELVWLIRTKSQKANKARVLAGLPPVRRGMGPAQPKVAPLTLVPPLPEVKPEPRRQRDGPPHLHAVPPLAP